MLCEAVLQRLRVHSTFSYLQGLGLMSHMDETGSRCHALQRDGIPDWSSMACMLDWVSPQRARSCLSMCNMTFRAGGWRTERSTDAAAAGAAANSTFMAHHRMSNTLDHCYTNDDLTNDACAGIRPSQVVLQQLRAQKTSSAVG